MCIPLLSVSYDSWYYLCDMIHFGWLAMRVWCWLILALESQHELQKSYGSGLIIWFYHNWVTHLNWVRSFTTWFRKPWIFFPEKLVDKRVNQLILPLRSDPGWPILHVHLFCLFLVLFFASPSLFFCVFLFPHNFTAGSGHCCHYTCVPLSTLYICFDFWYVSLW